MALQKEISVPLSNLTPDFIKKNYFHGIKISDQTGKEISDESFKYHISTAIATLEQELDIDIIPRIREDRIMYDSSGFFRMGAIYTNKRPVYNIEELSIYIGNKKVYTFPLDYLQIDNNRGVIYVIPTALSQLPITAEGRYIFPYLLGVKYFPDLWYIKYKTGYEENDNSIPSNLIHAICLRASINIFNELGDIIIGAGIANFSIGLDGYSQSIGTTSSATNAGYGARIVQYEKELKELIKLLRNYFRGIEIFSL